MPRRSLPAFVEENPDVLALVRFLRARGEPTLAARLELGELGAALVRRISLLIDDADGRAQTPGQIAHVRGLRQGLEAVTGKGPNA